MNASTAADDPSLQRLRDGARAAMAGGALLLAMLVAALPAVTHFAHAAMIPAAAATVPVGDGMPVMIAAGIYVLGCLWLWHSLPRHRSVSQGVLARFGPANQVTLLRLVLVASLAALVAAPVGQAGRWTIVGLALVASALDGLDGALARRTGLASELGARFDMETDALLVLVLALLAWRNGIAAGWVLLSGLLRYLFVAAAALQPWIARPLAPSLRRKTICVVQILCLIGCLVPGLAAAGAGLLALTGLTLLVYSFAADLVALHGQRLAVDQS